MGLDHIWNLNPWKQEVTVYSSPKTKQIKKKKQETFGSNNYVKLCMHLQPWKQGKSRNQNKRLELRACIRLPTTTMPLVRSLRHCISFCSIFNFLLNALFRVYSLFLQYRAGILRSLRDVPPAHYTLKIESLSLFLNTRKENYKSGTFEAGGYKWWFKYFGYLPK